MKLSPAQLHWLRWLEVNVSAAIDGQVLVGKVHGRTPVAAGVSFLHLIAKGAIEVRGERFYVTEHGRDLLKESQALTSGYGNEVQL